MKDFSRAGWKAAPLGAVAQIRPNKKEAKSVLADEDDVSFVPMDCLRVDQVALAQHEVRPLGKVYGGYTYFRDGDVLLAKITPCFENGKLGIANDLKNGVGFGSSEFFVLRPSEELLAGYLYHFLNRQSFRDWAKGQMTGAVGHKRVPKELVEALEIPLPPLEEQQRIVAVLDEAFEGLARARAHAEANLENARELFERAEEAVLAKDSEVDGKVVQLSDVAELRGGFAFKSKQYTETGHFVLRTVNITPDGTITRHNPKFISEGEVESHKKFALEPYDTLFVMVGATLGKTGFVEPHDLPALLNQNMWVIRAKSEEIDPHYLYHVFRRITRPAMEKATGTARGFLKRDDVRTLSFKLPPKNHQFSSVEQILALKAQALTAEHEYKTKLQDLDDLRQSLLQKAFAGELT